MIDLENQVLSLVEITGTSQPRFRHCGEIRLRNWRQGRLGYGGHVVQGQEQARKGSNQARGKVKEGPTGAAGSGASLAVASGAARRRAMQPRGPNPARPTL